MKKIVRNFIMVLSFVVLTFIFLGSEVDAGVREKTILYVATGSPTDLTTRTLADAFENSPNAKFKVFFEYIETGEWVEKSSKIKSMIEAKIDMIGSVNGVVFEGNGAAEFALSNQEMFKDIPVFFLGVDDSLAKDAKKMGVKCVVEEKKSIKENVELISRLLGPNKNIVLVTGPLDINKEIIDSFYAEKNKYPEMGFRNISLSYTSKSELVEQMSQLKRDDIILFWSPISHKPSRIVNYKDRAFDNLSEIVEILRSNTRQPMFSNLEYAVRDGFVGGYTIDIKKQGNMMAESVDKFLNAPNGHRINSNVGKKTHIISGDETETLTIDMNAAHHFKVDTLKIPRHAKKLYSTNYGVIQYKILTTSMVSVIFLLAVIVWVIMSKLKKQEIINAELKKLNDDLESAKEEAVKAKEEAIKANEYKSNFIRNISHELKTPVTVINSVAQLLMKLEESKGYISGDTLKYNLNVIGQNSCRLTRLINNILDVNKSEHGFATLHLKNVEVVGFIESAVMSVIPYAEKKDLEVLFDTEEEEIEMAVDLDKLDRVVLNLLSNAIKFSRNGGMILTELSVSEDNLLITVKDEGIGIKEEDFEYIFNKFAQVDNGFTRLTEGSGIGLSLVKEFVNLHDGTVSVESEIGVGSKFIVSIPIKMLENEEVLYNIPHDGSRTEAELSDIYG